MVDLFGDAMLVKALAVAGCRGRQRVVTTA